MLNIKKMLSLFVVLAMVIGMVPAVGLPAVVAKADTTQSINDQAKDMTFTGGTDNKYCPACDAVVDWIPLVAGAFMKEDGSSTPVISTNKHYYVYGNGQDVEVGAHTRGVLAQITTKGVSVCLNLNGKNMISKGNIAMSSGTKLNIMGNGSVTYLGTYPGSFKMQYSFIRTDNAQVNLYGGNYITTSTAKAEGYSIFWNYSTNSTLSILDDAKVYGTIDLVSNHHTDQNATTFKDGTIKVLTIDGNAYIQELKYNHSDLATMNLVVNPTFTGAVQNLSFGTGMLTDGVISGAKTSGAFTGTITTADSEKIEAADGGLKVTATIAKPTKDDAFAPDTHGGEAWCVHCGAVKDWVPYFGNNTTVLQGSTGVDHFHIYLTEDVNYTGSATNGNFIHSFENICLNLNGYDVSGLDADGKTVSQRAIRCTQTLAIMGDPENPGTITAGKSGSTDGIVAKGMKEFYLYAGANLTTASGGTAPVITCNDNANSQRSTPDKIVLNGGNIDGFVSDVLDDAIITLAGGASADLIKLTNAASKLSVAAGWSGEAVVQLPAALENGVVPAANGEAKGNFCGKLTTSDGVKLYNSNGSLSATATFDPDAEINYCEVCGDYVAWTALPTTNENMDLSAGKHYFVPQDMTFVGGENDQWLFKPATRTQLCLYLNGKTLTLDNARIYNGQAGSILNIIAAGGTIQSNHTRGLFYSDTGNTHLYGGTYLASGSKGIEINEKANGQYHFHGDAKLEGMITLVNGNVHLYDKAEVNKIVLSNTGKVTFHEGWTGSAVLDIDEALLTGKTVNTANAVVEGTFGGTLTTAAGYPISVSNGALVLDQPTKDTFDPWNYEGKAYCPVCDDYVNWVDYNAHVAANGYYDNDHKLNDPNPNGVPPTQHFYLSEDITYTTQCLSLNDKLHFNFNGCDVTATGDTATSAFRITQHAHFFNTGDVATVTGGVTGGTVGSVLENGGNAEKNNEADTWIYGNIVMIAPEGNEGPAVNMGSETNVLTVSGNTVISSLNLGTTDSLVDISGLTEGASIAMVGLKIGQTFTTKCENLMAVKDYISCADIVGPFGYVAEQMVVRAAAGIVSGGKVVWHGDNIEAVQAYTPENFADGAYIILSDEETLTLAGGNYYVDIAGKNLAVSGTGKLYPIDSANDDFEGFGQWTYEDVEIARDVTFGGNRYITITVDGKTSTHRLEMKLKSVSLRTSAAGLYYNAQYRCDATLAEQVSAYGVILSLKDMPGAELASGDKRTVLTNFAPNENHTVSATSCSVFGIFKDTRTAEKNAEYGKMKIYANAYIQLNLDGAAEILVADNENVGKQAGNAWSLYDVLKAIDQNWEEYADDQKNITEFYSQWADYGMDAYANDFENIDVDLDVESGDPVEPEGTDMDTTV